MFLHLFDGVMLFSLKNNEANTQARFNPEIMCFRTTARKIHDLCLLKLKFHDVTISLISEVRDIW